MTSRFSKSTPAPAILEALVQNEPSFFVDPLYDDTVYVHHALGVHCLMLRKWIDPLVEALRVKDDVKRETEVNRFLGRELQTEVVCVVDTVSQDET